MDFNNRCCGNTINSKCRTMLLSLLTIAILTRYFSAVQAAECKKHVQNSVYPFDVETPTYDIESWVKQLHLQQCAFVEVGDKHYAIFVETRPRRYDQEKEIKEYFLGVCDDDTVSKWPLCSPNLHKKRSRDCTFHNNNMYGARVHRRFCDISLISQEGPQCDCNTELSDVKLYKVQGFPTCFKPPLPDSLCGDNNVCGLAACTPETINKKVHTAKCDKKCLHQQPFCEPPDRSSSQPRSIRSFWTDWGNPYCTDISCVSQFDEAVCINRETGHGDIDCLGPGTSCCTPDIQNCRCHVYEEDGTAKVFRTFSMPQPELIDYMSEEDFINSIPLRYLDKEEYHKYPPGRAYPVSRGLRSVSLGSALKQTIYDIYDRRPIKFGNKHALHRHPFRNLKSSILRTFQQKDKLVKKKKRVTRDKDKVAITKTKRLAAEGKENKFNAEEKGYTWFGTDKIVEETPNLKLSLENVKKKHLVSDRQRRGGSGDEINVKEVRKKIRRKLRLDNGKNPTNKESNGAKLSKVLEDRNTIFKNDPVQFLDQAKLAKPQPSQTFQTNQFVNAPTIKKLNSHERIWKTKDKLDRETGQILKKKDSNGEGISVRNTVLTESPIPPTAAISIVRIEESVDFNVKDNQDPDQTVVNIKDFNTKIHDPDKGVLNGKTREKDDVAREKEDAFNAINDLPVSYNEERKQARGTETEMLDPYNVRARDAFNLIKDSPVSFDEDRELENVDDEDFYRLPSRIGSWAKFEEDSSDEENINNGKPRRYAKITNAEEIQDDPEIESLRCSDFPGRPIQRFLKLRNFKRKRLFDLPRASFSSKNFPDFQEPRREIRDVKFKDFRESEPDFRRVTNAPDDELDETSATIKAKTFQVRDFRKAPGRLKGDSETPDEKIGTMHLHIKDFRSPLKDPDDLYVQKKNSIHGEATTDFLGRPTVEAEKNVRLEPNSNIQSSSSPDYRHVYIKDFRASEANPTAKTDGKPERIIESDYLHFTHFPATDPAGYPIQNNLATELEGFKDVTESDRKIEIEDFRALEDAAAEKRATASGDAKGTATNWMPNRVRNILKKLGKKFGANSADTVVNIHLKRLAEETTRTAQKRDIYGRDDFESSEEVTAINGFEDAAISSGDEGIGQKRKIKVANKFEGDDSAEVAEPPSTEQQHHLEIPSEDRKVGQKETKVAQKRNHDGERLDDSGQVAEGSNQRQEFKILAMDDFKNVDKASEQKGNDNLRNDKDSTGSEVYENKRSQQMGNLETVAEKNTFEDSTKNEALKPENAKEVPERKNEAHKRMQTSKNDFGRAIRKHQRHSTNFFKSRKNPARANNLNLEGVRKSVSGHFEDGGEPSGIERNMQAQNSESLEKYESKPKLAETPTKEHPILFKLVNHEHMKKRKNKRRNLIRKSIQSNNENHKFMKENPEFHAKRRVKILDDRIAREPTKIEENLSGSPRNFRKRREIAHLNFFDGTGPGSAANRRQIVGQKFRRRNDPGPGKYLNRKQSLTSSKESIGTRDSKIVPKNRRSRRSVATGENQSRDSSSNFEREYPEIKNAAEVMSCEDVHEKTQIGRIVAINAKRKNHSGVRMNSHPEPIFKAGREKGGIAHGRHFKAGATTRIPSKIYKHKDENEQRRDTIEKYNQRYEEQHQNAMQKRHRKDNQREATKKRDQKTFGEPGGRNLDLNRFEDAITYLQKHYEEMRKLEANPGNRIEADGDVSSKHIDDATNDITTISSKTVKGGTGDFKVISSENVQSGTGDLSSKNFKEDTGDLPISSKIFNGDIADPQEIHSKNFIDDPQKASENDPAADKTVSSKNFGDGTDDQTISSNNLDDAIYDQTVSSNSFDDRTVSSNNFGGATGNRTVSSNNFSGATSNRTVSSKNFGGATGNQSVSSKTVDDTTDDESVSSKNIDAINDQTISSNNFDNFPEDLPIIRITSASNASGHPVYTIRTDCALSSDNFEDATDNLVAKVVPEGNTEDLGPEKKKKDCLDLDPKNARSDETIEVCIPSGDVKEGQSDGTPNPDSSVPESAFFVPPVLATDLQGGNNGAAESPKDEVDTPSSIMIPGFASSETEQPASDSQDFVVHAGILNPGTNADSRLSALSQSCSAGGGGEVLPTVPTTTPHVNVTKAGNTNATSEPVTVAAMKNGKSKQVGNGGNKNATSQVVENATPVLGHCKTGVLNLLKPGNKCARPQTGGDNLEHAKNDTQPAFNVIISNSTSQNVTDATTTQKVITNGTITTMLQNEVNNATMTITIQNAVTNGTMTTAIQNEVNNVTMTTTIQNEVSNGTTATLTVNGTTVTSNETTAQSVNSTQIVAQNVSPEAETSETQTAKVCSQKCSNLADILLPHAHKCKVCKPTCKVCTPPPKCKVCRPVTCIVCETKKCKVSTTPPPDETDKCKVCPPSPDENIVPSPPEDPPSPDDDDECNKCQVCPPPPVKCKACRPPTKKCKVCCPPIKKCKVCCPPTKKCKVCCPPTKKCKVCTPPTKKCKVCPPKPCDTCKKDLEALIADIARPVHTRFRPSCKKRLRNDSATQLFDINGKASGTRDIDKSQVKNLFKALTKLNQHTESPKKSSCGSCGTKIFGPEGNHKHCDCDAANRVSPMEIPPLMQNFGQEPYQYSVTPTVNNRFPNEVQSIKQREFFPENRVPPEENWSQPKNTYQAPNQANLAQNQMSNQNLYQNSNLDMNQQNINLDRNHQNMNPDTNQQTLNLDTNYQNMNLDINHQGFPPEKDRQGIVNQEINRQTFMDNFNLEVNNQVRDRLLQSHNLEKNRQSQESNMNNQGGFMPNYNPPNYHMGALQTQGLEKKQEDLLQNNRPGETLYNLDKYRQSTPQNFNQEKISNSGFNSEKQHYNSEEYGPAKNREDLKQHFSPETNHEDLKQHFGSAKNQEDSKQTFSSGKNQDLKQNNHEELQQALGPQKKIEDSKQNYNHEAFAPQKTFEDSKLNYNRVAFGPPKNVDDSKQSYNHGELKQAFGPQKNFEDSKLNYNHEAFGPPKNFEDSKQNYNHEAFGPPKNVVDSKQNYNQQAFGQEKTIDDLKQKFSTEKNRDLEQNLGSTKNVEDLLQKISPDKKHEYLKLNLQQKNEEQNDPARIPLLADQLNGAFDRKTTSPQGYLQKTPNLLAKPAEMETSETKRILNLGSLDLSTKNLREVLVTPRTKLFGLKNDHHDDNLRVQNKDFIQSHKSHSDADREIGDHQTTKTILGNNHYTKGNAQKDNLRKLILQNSRYAHNMKDNSNQRRSETFRHYHERLHKENLNHNYLNGKVEDRRGPNCQRLRKDQYFHNAENMGDLHDHGREDLSSRNQVLDVENVSHGLHEDQSSHNQELDPNNVKDLHDHGLRNEQSSHNQELDVHGNMEDVHDLGLHEGRHANKPNRNYYYPKCFPGSQQIDPKHNFLKGKNWNVHDPRHNKDVEIRLQDYEPNIGGHQEAFGKLEMDNKHLQNNRRNLKLGEASELQEKIENSNHRFELHRHNPKFTHVEEFGEELQNNRQHELQGHNPKLSHEEELGHQQTMQENQQNRQLGDVTVFGAQQKLQKDNDDKLHYVLINNRPRYKPKFSHVGEFGVQQKSQKDNEEKLVLDLVNIRKNGLEKYKPYIGGHLEAFAVQQKLDKDNKDQKNNPRHGLHVYNPKLGRVEGQLLQKGNKGQQNNLQLWLQRYNPKLGQGNKVIVQQKIKQDNEYQRNHVEGFGHQQNNRQHELQRNNPRFGLWGGTSDAQKDNENQQTQNELYNPTLSHANMVVGDKQEFQKDRQNNLQNEWHGNNPRFGQDDNENQQNNRHGQRCNPTLLKRVNVVVGNNPTIQKDNMKKLDHNLRNNLHHGLHKYSPKSSRVEWMTYLDKLRKDKGECSHQLLKPSPDTYREQAFVDLEKLQKEKEEWYKQKHLPARYHVYELPTRFRNSYQGLHGRNRLESFSKPQQDSNEDMDDGLQSRRKQAKHRQDLEADEDMKDQKDYHSVQQALYEDNLRFPQQHNQNPNYIRNGVVFLDNPERKFGKDNPFRNSNVGPAGSLDSFQNEDRLQPASQGSSEDTLSNGQLLFHALNRAPYTESNYYNDDRYNLGRIPEQNVQRSYEDTEDKYTHNEVSPEPIEVQNYVLPTQSTNFENKNFGRKPYEENHRESNLDTEVEYQLRGFEPEQDIQRSQGKGTKNDYESKDFDANAPSDDPGTYVAPDQDNQRSHEDNHRGGAFFEGKDVPNSELGNQRYEHNFQKTEPEHSAESLKGDDLGSAQNDKEGFIKDPSTCPYPGKVHGILLVTDAHIIHNLLHPPTTTTDASFEDEGNQRKFKGNSTDSTDNLKPDGMAFKEHEDYVTDSFCSVKNNSNRSGSSKNNLTARDARTSPTDCNPGNEFPHYNIKLFEEMAKQSNQTGCKENKDKPSRNDANSRNDGPKSSEPNNNVQSREDNPGSSEANNFRSTKLMEELQKLLRGQLRNDAKSEDNPQSSSKATENDVAANPANSKEGAGFSNSPDVTFQTDNVKFGGGNWQRSLENPSKSTENYFTDSFSSPVVSKSRGEGNSPGFGSNKSKSREGYIRKLQNLPISVDGDKIALENYMKNNFGSLRKSLQNLEQTSSESLQNPQNSNFVSPLPNLVQTSQDYRKSSQDPYKYNFGSSPLLNLVQTSEVYSKALPNPYKNYNFGSSLQNLAQNSIVGRQADVVPFHDDLSQGSMKVSKDIHPEPTYRTENNIYQKNEAAAEEQPLGENAIQHDPPVQNCPPSNDAETKPEIVSGPTRNLEKFPAEPNFEDVNPEKVHFAILAKKKDYIADIARNLYNENLKHDVKASATDDMLLRELDEDILKQRQIGHMKKLEAERLREQNPLIGVKVGRGRPKSSLYFSDMSGKKVYLRNVQGRSKVVSEERPEFISKGNLGFVPRRSYYDRNSLRARNVNSLREGKNNYFRSSKYLRNARHFDRIKATSRFQKESDAETVTSGRIKPIMSFLRTRPNNQLDSSTKFTEESLDASRFQGADRVESLGGTLDTKTSPNHVFRSKPKSTEDVSRTPKASDRSIGGTRNAKSRPNHVFRSITKSADVPRFQKSKESDEMYPKYSAFLKPQPMVEGNSQRLTNADQLISTRNYRDDEMVLAFQFETPRTMKFSVVEEQLGRASNTKDNVTPYFAAPAEWPVVAEQASRSANKMDAGFSTDQISSIVQLPIRNVKSETGNNDVRADWNSKGECSPINEHLAPMAELTPGTIGAIAMDNFKTTMNNQKGDDRALQHSFGSMTTVPGDFSSKAMPMGDECDECLLDFDTQNNKQTQGGATIDKYPDSPLDVQTGRVGIGSQKSFESPIFIPAQIAVATKPAPPESNGFMQPGTHEEHSGASHPALNCLDNCGFLQVGVDTTKPQPAADFNDATAMTKSPIQAIIQNPDIHYSEMGHQPNNEIDNCGHLKVTVDVEKPQQDAASIISQNPPMVTPGVEYPGSGCLKVASDTEKPQHDAAFDYAPTMTAIPGVEYPSPPDVGHQGYNCNEKSDHISPCEYKMLINANTPPESVECDNSSVKSDQMSPCEFKMLLSTEKPPGNDGVECPGTSELGHECDKPDLISPCEYKLIFSTEKPQAISSASGPESGFKDLDNLSASGTSLPCSEETESPCQNQEKADSSSKFLESLVGTNNFKQAGSLYSQEFSERPILILNAPDEQKNYKPENYLNQGSIPCPKEPSLEDNIPCPKELEGEDIECSKEKIQEPLLSNEYQEKQNSILCAEEANGCQQPKENNQQISCQQDTLKSSEHPSPAKCQETESSTEGNDVKCTPKTEAKAPQATNVNNEKAPTIQTSSKCPEKAPSQLHEASAKQTEAHAKQGNSSEALTKHKSKYAQKNLLELIKAFTKHYNIRYHKHPSPRPKVVQAPAKHTSIPCPPNSTHPEAEAPIRPNNTPCPTEPLPPCAPQESEPPKLHNNISCPHKLPETDAEMRNNNIPCPKHNNIPSPPVEQQNTTSCLEQQTLQTSEPCPKKLQEPIYTNRTDQDNETTTPLLLYITVESEPNKQERYIEKPINDETKKLSDSISDLANNDSNDIPEKTHDLVIQYEPPKSSKSKQCGGVFSKIRNVCKSVENELVTNQENAADLDLREDELKPDLSKDLYGEVADDLDISNGVGADKMGAVSDGLNGEVYEFTEASKPDLYEDVAGNQKSYEDIAGNQQKPDFEDLKSIKPDSSKESRGEVAEDLNPPKPDSNKDLVADDLNNSNAGDGAETLQQIREDLELASSRNLHEKEVVDDIKSSKPGSPEEVGDLNSSNEDLGTKTLQLIGKGLEPDLHEDLESSKPGLHEAVPFDLNNSIKDHALQQIGKNWKPDSNEGVADVLNQSNRDNSVKVLEDWGFQKALDLNVNGPNEWRKDVDMQKLPNERVHTPIDSSKNIKEDSNKRFDAHQDKLMRLHNNEVANTLGEAGQDLNVNGNARVLYKIVNAPIESSKDLRMNNGGARVLNKIINGEIAASKDLKENHDGARILYEIVNGPIASSKVVLDSIRPSAEADSYPAFLATENYDHTDFSKNIKSSDAVPEEKYDGIDLTGEGIENDHFSEKSLSSRDVGDSGFLDSSPRSIFNLAPEDSKGYTAKDMMSVSKDYNLEDIKLASNNLVANAPPEKSKGYNFKDIRYDLLANGNLRAPTTSNVKYDVASNEQNLKYIRSDRFTTSNWFDYNLKDARSDLLGSGKWNKNDKFKDVRSDLHASSKGNGNLKNIRSYHLPTSIWFDSTQGYNLLDIRTDILMTRKSKEQTKSRYNFFKGYHLKDVVSSDPLASNILKELAVPESKRYSLKDLSSDLLASSKWNGKTVSNKSLKYIRSNRLTTTNWFDYTQVGKPNDYNLKVIRSSLVGSGKSKDFKDLSSEWNGKVQPDKSEGYSFNGIGTDLRAIRKWNEPHKPYLLTTRQSKAFNFIDLFTPSHWLDRTEPPKSKDYNLKDIRSELLESRKLISIADSAKKVIDSLSVDSGRSNAGGNLPTDFRKFEKAPRSKVLKSVDCEERTESDGADYMLRDKLIKLYSVSYQNDMDSIEIPPIADNLVTPTSAYALSDLSPMDHPCFADSQTPKINLETDFKQQTVSSSEQLKQVAGKSTEIDIHLNLKQKTSTQKPIDKAPGKTLEEELMQKAQKLTAGVQVDQAKASFNNTVQTSKAETVTKPTQKAANLQTNSTFASSKQADKETERSTISTQLTSTALASSDITTKGNAKHRNKLKKQPKLKLLLGDVLLKDNNANVACGNASEPIGTTEEAEGDFKEDDFEDRLHLEENMDEKDQPNVEDNENEAETQQETSVGVGEAQDEVPPQQRYKKPKDEPDENENPQSHTSIEDDHDGKERRRKVKPRPTNAQVFEDEDERYANQMKTTGSRCNSTVINREEEDEDENIRLRARELAQEEISDDDDMDEDEDDGKEDIMIEYDDVKVNTSTTTESQHERGDPTKSVSSEGLEGDQEVASSEGFNIKASMLACCISCNLFYYYNI